MKISRRSYKLTSFIYLCHCSWQSNPFYGSMLAIQCYNELLWSCAIALDSIALLQIKFAITTTKKLKQKSKCYKFSITLFNSKLPFALFKCQCMQTQSGINIQCQNIVLNCQRRCQCVKISQFDFISQYRCCNSTTCLPHRSCYFFSFH